MNSAGIKRMLDGLGFGKLFGFFDSLEALEIYKII